MKLKTQLELICEPIAKLKTAAVCNGAVYEFCNWLYKKLNKKKLIHPDPLEFLYDYDNIGDREIAGLISSSLAYGQVRQILKSVSIVLEKISPPREFLLNSSERELKLVLKDFKHRFTTGNELALMLEGVRSAIIKYGSLENCFLSGLKENAPDITGALEFFVQKISFRFGAHGTYLLPFPSRGSACKRLNLYLRWMVRKDEVDPGGWKQVPKSKLLIPLDTHMWKICKALNFATRNQADLKAVYEITENFRRISPDDPVKYDFALTRLGIHPKMDGIKDLVKYFTA